MRLRLLCACSVLALASALPVIRDDAPTDVFGTGLDSAVISEPNMDSKCKYVHYRITAAHFAGY